MCTALKNISVMAPASINVHQFRALGSYKMAPVALPPQNFLGINAYKNNVRMGSRM